MRGLLVVTWLFAGLSGLIYHLGPGVEQRAIDQAGACVQQARDAVDNEDWSRAVECFDEALASLPAERIREGRTLRLEKAKAQMMAAQLPEARAGLEILLQEVLTEDADNHQLINQSRAALANSQYYITWLMRLEGLAKEVWAPEIEAARQHYRVLAQDARDRGDLLLAKNSDEDLEAAIRLGRMDLAELQGLPLPSQ